MHDNHTYNLMSQIVQEHRSLWRIMNEYKKDAGDCETCKAFWEKMEKDKDDHIKELNEMIKNHI
jgi:hypothetical protein